MPLPDAALRATHALVGGCATRLLARLGPIAIAGLLASAAHAAPWEVTRQQEMAQCLPGELSVWQDGTDRPAVARSLVFAYNHAAAPAWFPVAEVQGALERAAQAWSQCGIPARVELLAPGAAATPGAVLVQWSEEGSRHNFGLANLSQKSISLGPAAFQLLQTRNPGYDARQTLQMVIAHEMGHLFGVIAHSRRCVDVTSYYDNGRGEHCFIRDGAAMPPGVEYRATLPTACDIQRCRAANR
jgi:hypothetical protein